MIKALILSVCSLTLTAIVIGNAYYQKKQFYPSVVYLTKSNPSMAVIYLQAFVIVLLMGKLMRKVFFGQLRVAEMEHLIERSWYAVTETCLAFTVFRDDFSPKFVALFTLLLFLKCFHWLAEDRVDYMERSPVISLLFHVRVVSLLVLLATLDFFFISHAYHSTLTKGASVQLVFGFEYAILWTIIFNIFVKYLLHTIDIHCENPWENKAVYLLYSELLMGFVKVVLYLTFMMIMIKIHTFPLFAIRPMYLSIRAFKKAVNDVIMSRRAIRNMNTLYPNATAEDLSTADNVCIICREEMTGSGNSSKKLPCHHMFHTACLRSWFQRQQTCPTCRMDVLQAATQAPPAPQPEPEVVPPPAPPMNWPPFNPQQPQEQNQQQQPTPSAANQNQLPQNVAFSQSIPLPFPFMPLLLPSPPPPPRMSLSHLTEEELRQMEGQTRQHVEARLECLHNIQTLMDAAMVQMQQYSTLVASLGNQTIPAPAYVASPHSSTVPDSTSNPTSASVPIPVPDAESVPETPEDTDDTSPAREQSQPLTPNEEARRRRLERFQPNNQPNQD